MSQSDYVTEWLKKTNKLIVNKKSTKWEQSSLCISKHLEMASPPVHNNIVTPHHWFLVAPLSKCFRLSFWTVNKKKVNEKKSDLKYHFPFIFKFGKNDEYVTCSAPNSLHAKTQSGHIVAWLGLFFSFWMKTHFIADCFWVEILYFKELPNQPWMVKQYFA